MIGGVASVVLWQWIRHRAATRLQRVALALLLGGALGNVFDRLVRGAVVDWIDVYWVDAEGHDWHWPAFNVADIAIGSGALLLLVVALGRQAATEPPRG